MKNSETKKLDKLWSMTIVARDQRCKRCGKLEALQAAHIFSRSNRSTRWDIKNGLTLCNGCHIFWAHKNPVEFTEFIKELLGEEEYQALRRRAVSIVKPIFKFWKPILDKQYDEYKI